MSLNFAYQEPVPRYFWRRLAAFFLDGLILQIVISIAMSVIMSAAGSPAFGHLDTKTCTSKLTFQSDRTILQAMGLKEGAQTLEMTCPYRSPSGAESQIIIVFYDAILNEGELPKLAMFDKNPAGALTKTDLLPHPAWLVLVFLLFPLAMAFLNSNGRRSPGKIALGLRVQRWQQGFPSFTLSFIRELLKYLPGLICIALAFTFFQGFEATLKGMLFFSRSGQFSDLPAIFKLLPVYSLSSLLWLLLPYLFWRGQTFYDMMAGCKVVKKDQN